MAITNENGPSESRPFRIVLVNMPCAYLAMPSIALTQLAAVLRDRFGAAVDVSILYLNLDFAGYLEAEELYDHTQSATALQTGIGEWFFRKSAFPEAEDNAGAYYGRYYFADDDATRTLRRRLEQKRMGVDGFLDEMMDRYDLLEADLIGFTTLFTQTVASLALARRIKHRNPEVVTVIGGSACDACMGMEIADHVSAIDAVFSGPALESFPRYVEALLRSDAAGTHDIHGVFTRSNRARWPGRAGGGKGEPPLALLGQASDINNLVPLDYHSFLADLSAAFPNNALAPVLLFETSRGCWWAEKVVCSFCGLNGLQVQHRALRPENAIAHIESLYPYVPECRIFLGVDTILPRGYTQDVFPELTPPPEMTLFYELKVDVSKAELATLVRAGVRAFQPGIESLSTSTLKRMRKGTSAFRNIQFLKHCSEHPVRVDWNLLVFTPGEKEEVYEKALGDMPHLRHLAPPTGAYPISFARFSRYFEDPQTYQLDLKPQDFYGLIYPFDDQSVSNLAYHFVDRNADTVRIDEWLDRLNTAIARWSQRWLGQDGKPQARLCYTSGERDGAVYDSRTGDEVETGIGDEEMGMLYRMEEPCTALQLIAEFGPDAESCLKRFQARGWLFEEDGRFLSLVT